jgi:uncharacterized protein (TIGR02452 family)
MRIVNMGRWGKDGDDLAGETLRIVDERKYTAPSGREVRLEAEIEHALDGTLLYRPHELTRLVKTSMPATSRTIVEVTPEGTSEAGRRLLAEGERDVVVLNFASARSVGGGFLRGAKAQEEDLCRASALYRCLETQPDYYDANRAHPDALYTDHIIYSPRVPFFRDENKHLLEEPYLLSVITAPAPCTREIVEHTPQLEPAIREVFVRRAAMVLAVARDQGHDCVVLGAWGCGAFRGDPQVAADAFDQALKLQFAGAFRRVVFAVLVARGADQRNYDVFSGLRG